MTNSQNVSLLISGTAGWNHLVEPQDSKFGTKQYTLFIQNPSFADAQGNSDPATMDPATAAAIQKIEASGLVKPGNQQYPNPSVAVNLSAQRQDGTIQHPHYYDRKTQSEVPVEHNIGTGQPIQVAVNVNTASNSKYGLTLYLDGVIFDDVSKAQWYTQSPLLAGFKPLADDETSKPAVTPQAFANANAVSQNPFANNQPAQSQAPAQSQNPFADNQPVQPQAPAQSQNPFADNQPVQPQAPAQSQNPFANNQPAQPQAPVQGQANPFANNQPAQPQAPVQGQANPFADNQPAQPQAPKGNPFA